MNRESRVETAPQPQGQRLTLRRARTALIRRLCSVLLLSGFGLYLLLHGGKTSATFLCLGAVISVALLPVDWKLYRTVEAGAVITVQPQVTAQLVRVHPAASIAVTSLMTLMVLVMSAGTVYIFLLMSPPLGIKFILASLNAILWPLTGLFWYRIATERRKTTIVEPFYEQVEGVWPPAPQVPKIE